MTRLPQNVFAKCFLVLLLMQQGFASVAMAAAERQQRAGGNDIAAMAHDCEGMSVQDTDHSTSHAVTVETMQHEHQECIEAGCDNCIGCVTCAIGYSSSDAMYMSGQPIVTPAYIAAPMPEPDRLYRPPINN